MSMGQRENASSVMYLNTKLCFVKYEAFLYISILKSFVYQKFNSFSHRPFYSYSHKKKMSVLNTEFFQQVLMYLFFMPFTGFPSA